MKRLIVNEKAIRRRMIDLDIKSVNQLSNISKVSRPVIYEYFGGKSPFSNTFLRLCASLDVKPNELLIESI